MIAPVSPGGNRELDRFEPPERAAPVPPAEPAPAAEFAFLGEPFTTYARLLTALGDARDRLWPAQVAKDVAAVRAAELTLDEAQASLWSFKHHAACTFLMGARFSAEMFPGFLQTHLDPAFRRELSHTQDELRELRDENRELRDENRELRDELHSLKQRVEESEDAIVRLEFGEGAPA